MVWYVMLYTHVVNFRHLFVIKIKIVIKKSVLLIIEHICYTSSNSRFFCITATSNLHHTYLVGLVACRTLTLVMQNKCGDNAKWANAMPQTSESTLSIVHKLFTSCNTTSLLLCSSLLLRALSHCALTFTHPSWQHACPSVAYGMCSGSKHSQRLYIHGAKTYKKWKPDDAKCVAG